MSSADFYRAFEERYRGPRELIRKRLEAYLPFITPLQNIYQPTKVIDLGCGRGEWLELLQEYGFQGEGVDLDAAMLHACTERGLNAIQGDAIDHLNALPNNSQSIVTGFHLAEHLPFEALQTLITQALRVLQPGGLLILETPNPENLVVGACQFYLDPTHIRPLPPQLLAFLPEHQGYHRVHTLRLQERPELHNQTTVPLIDVLSGVSPDYAVVAQKAGPANVMELLDQAFATHTGLGLEQLTTQFDSGLQARHDGLLHQSNVLAQQVRSQLAQAEYMSETAREQLQTLSKQVQDQSVLTEHLTALLEQQLQEAKEQRQREREAMQFHIQQLQTELATAQHRLDEVHQANHRHHQLAEARQQTILAMEHSWSWALTRPLRFGAALVRHPERSMSSMVNATVHHTIELLQKPLAGLMHRVLRNPHYSNRINHWLLTRFPDLQRHLQSVAHRHGIIQRPVVHATAHPQTVVVQSTSQAALTLRARKIHAKLIAALKYTREE